jgi:hypothetical protein
MYSTCLFTHSVPIDCSVQFHIEYPQSRHHYTHVNMTLPTQNHLIMNREMVAHFLSEYYAYASFISVYRYYADPSGHAV